MRVRFFVLGMFENPPLNPSTYPTLGGLWACDVSNRGQKACPKAQFDSIYNSLFISVLFRTAGMAVNGALFRRETVLLTRC
jgi:hypothetical protein